jgi:hypothetical protein
VKAALGPAGPLFRPREPALAAPSPTFSPFQPPTTFSCPPLDRRYAERQICPPLAELPGTQQTLGANARCAGLARLAAVIW